MKQNRAKIIGITGGIATGKSTVVKILKSMNFIVIEADEISKEVVKKGKPGLTKIVEKFGENILLEDGELNRKKLGEIIFNNEDKRKELNEIMHPIIIKEILDRLKSYIFKYDIIFIDMPLLFETKELLSDMGLYFDEIWLVYCDEDVQLNRLMKRENIEFDYALKKIKSQLDSNYKKKYSDKIIYNNGSLEELEKTVIDMVKELRSDKNEKDV
ncbi:MAG: dephospho-CoA kinase [Tissierellales bacterium]|nr:dephospho-CoA kinase [Tissierellales bacterium]